MKGWWTCSRAGNTAFVTIGGEIGAFDSGHDVGHLLEELHGADEIFLKVNSDGGDAAAAIELYEALRGRCRQAVVKRACSAAVVITLAADRILVEPGAKFMIHQAQGAVFGSAVELRQAAAIVADRNETFVEILHNRTGKSTKKIWKLFDGNDHWFTAEQAVNHGLADEILKVGTIRTDGTAHDGRPDSFKIETDDSEKLFMDLLMAIGPIQTSNRRALFDKIAHWARLNITES